MEIPDLINQTHSFVLYCQTPVSLLVKPMSVGRVVDFVFPLSQEQVTGRARALAKIYRTKCMVYYRLGIWQKIKAKGQLSWIVTQGWSPTIPRSYTSP